MSGRDGLGRAAAARGASPGAVRHFLDRAGAGARTFVAVREGLPPGPSAPLPRQALEYVRDPLGMLERCAREYGEPFTLRVARGAPFVVFSDPDAVRRVFTAGPEVLRSGEANAVFEAGLGPRSLIVLDGEAHMRDRKLVLPPFHGERMRAYGELMERIAAREARTWTPGRPFPVAEGMRRIALEVIVRAVFGVTDPARVGLVARRLRTFMEAGTGKAGTYVALMIEPGGLTMRAFNRFNPPKRRVDALVREEIARARSDPRLEEREDVLALLARARFDDGSAMDAEHIRDELVTLLAAGHETTANASAWALAELARRPEALERAAADDDYLDAVVKETLRLRTIITFLPRMTTEPFELLGRRLPAGVRVAPSNHLVHRRPDLYPDPEEFRPERFLERPAGTYTWIPFGGGTRRCVGAAFATFEMKTVVRVVARQGRVLPATDRDEGVGRRGLTLAPARGGRVVWEPRAA